MNRKITTTITILAALVSLSACNFVEAAKRVVPSDSPSEVDYHDAVVGVEGRPGISSLTPATSLACEGANCPPVAPATYPPCVTEGAFNVCRGEGANG